MNPVQRRQAIVTGGSNGIGFGIALNLCERGYDVVLIGRNASRGQAALDALKAQGHRAQFISADFALMSEVDRAATIIAERLDRIDLLVHSAGVVDGARRLTSEGIDLNFAINYLARF